MRPARLRAAGLTLLGLAAACAPAAPGRIDPSDCRRVPLLDRGRAVTGAEDMDLAGGMLFVSAYDRPAAEAAAREPDGPEPPAGGLYAVPVAALGGASRLGVTDLLAPALGRRARPHGLDAVTAPDGEPLIAVIVRDYARETDEWRMEGKLAALKPGEKAVEAPVDADANDVLATPGGVVLSYDGGRGLSPAGRVVRTGTPAERLGGEFSFANGLVIDRAGRTWVAETRGGRITEVESGRQIALPGGPDNLTLAPDGRILAALHPSLIRYALHRFAWPGGERAATRIVAVDPESGAVEVLLDDPDGSVFSGATVAASAGGFLVLGAVREPGLLVCPLP